MTTQDLSEQQQIRRAKREKLLEQGKDAYPVEVDRTTSLSELREKYSVVESGADGVTTLEAGQETQDEVAVAGRIMFQRNTGKLCFATLQEGDGTQLQVMLSLAEVGEEALADWKSDTDLGDIVSVRGRVIASKRLSLIHI